jgi:transposase-like protein
MRSNRAVHEELQRLMAYLEPPLDPCCINFDCVLFDVPLPLAGDLYVQFGKTAAGTPRYRCGACMKTFTGAGKPAKRHRMPHKNREVFSLLVNKMPFRRICEHTQLSPQTLYDKLDFIYKQCLAFLGSRERPLLAGMTLPKLYLATDRQILAANWSNRKDKRNVALQAIATADLKSGYVFGMDLNFDPSLDLDLVESMVHINGDAILPQPYRRYARLWLRVDYEGAVAEAMVRKATKKAKAKKKSIDPLIAQIEAAYEDAEVREDVEETHLLEKDQSLPTTGVEVRDQYTVYAHFLMMERLIGYAPKVRFYMDQDSGFRAAFMSAFHGQIKARRADGWFVSILKETTVEEKRKAVKESKTRLMEAMAENPGLSQREVEILMTLDEMKHMTTIGKWGDRWLSHPVPTKSEPDKRLCWLTNIGLIAEEDDTIEDVQKHAAHLFLKGSLHAVDRFFMLTRRRLSLAERPYASASSDRRMWHGYSAYQPYNLTKVLTILKTVHNYTLTDEDNRTPAMKLGLAQAPISLESILYFGGAPNE